MKKKSLIKSRAATKKALIASRKGTASKVSAANVAAGVAAGVAAANTKIGSVLSPAVAAPPQVSIQTGSVTFAQLPSAMVIKD